MNAEVSGEKEDEGEGLFQYRSTSLIPYRQQFLMIEVPLFRGEWGGRGGGARLTRDGGACQAYQARVRQSQPDSGLGFQVKVLKTF